MLLAAASIVFIDGHDYANGSTRMTGILEGQYQCTTTSCAPLTTPAPSFSVDEYRRLDDPFLPIAFPSSQTRAPMRCWREPGCRGGLPTAWDIVVDLISQMAGDDEGVEISAESAAPWYERRFGRTPPTVML